MASTSVSVSGASLSERLVDTDDQLRDRAQPGKLRIRHHDLEQFTRRRAAVDAVVGGTLPVEQRLVQVEQGVAEVRQQLTFALLHVRSRSLQLPRPGRRSSQPDQHHSHYQQDSAHQSARRQAVHVDTKPSEVVYHQ